MCGVDPHELPPLIVSQVIDEGVVGEIACKGIAATDGGQAFLDQNVTILFGAECGTQAGQRWHTWHDPFAKHTMREPDPEGASEQPRNSKSKSSHFPVHRLSQMLADLAEVPAFKSRVSATPQALDLRDDFVCSS